KGDASKARDYLPTEKQCLVTRGVPCLRRATSMACTDSAAADKPRGNACRARGHCGLCCEPRQDRWIPGIVGDGLASAMEDVSMH
ncbi:hypothetical protein P692DRAFT_201716030, partial [Suillus brevipes Sb2]